MTPSNMKHDGWRLTLALPSEVREMDDKLVAFVIAVAAGRVVEPMRHSRHAMTFQTQFIGESSGAINLFVKAIEQPRGIGRLKRLLRGSPTLHVAQITAELAVAGLKAPPAWIYGSNVASGRELLVTPRAEGDGPLRTLAATAGAVSTKRAILQALGAEVARLHRSGFVHGDLTPFNIFVVRGEPPRFVLLDHERTRRAFLLGRSRRQSRNLVQLGRFKLPGLSRADRLRTLRAYTAAMKQSNPRKFTRRINAMLERRISRDGGLQEISPLPRATKRSEASV